MPPAGSDSGGRVNYDGQVGRVATYRKHQRPQFRTFDGLLSCRGCQCRVGGQAEFCETLAQAQGHSETEKNSGAQAQSKHSLWIIEYHYEASTKARCKRCGCALCKAAQKQVGKENAKCAASESEVTLFSSSGPRGRAPLVPSKSKLQACVRSCCSDTACWRSQFGGGGSKDETTPVVTVVVPEPAPVLSVLMGK